MFLKSLEIFGFKSFADRTRINFADGITALLGPNGCGKSNVVDAIKWVLAENRSKNLRAATMEDVIFNGTESRPALSLAEVTLTIANENRLLEIDDEEIAIKRRLYRSGENEYFINDRQVTATEIRRLFMDTGVGKAAYSVMEQGKIDQILSSKPEDRRYLFEEAAGITSSKAKVAEAERDIERTRINLSQIEITLAETKRNYESLKVQADKTSKYRKYNEDKFNYELDIQLLKLKDFIQNKARQEKKVEEIKAKRDAYAKEIEEIYNTLNENTDKIKTLSEQISLKQQELAKLGAEQEGKKEMAKNLRFQQSSVKEKIGQIENRIKNIKERIDEYNEDIDSRNAELHEKEKELDGIRQNIENFTSSIELSSGQIDENQRQIGTNAGKIHNLDSERSELQKQLAAITEDIVKELDAKLKEAGYSSVKNKKAKEDINTQLEKIKIFTGGRTNIFKDYSSLASHTEKDASKFGEDAVQAFTQLGTMLDELSVSIDTFIKTSPLFIDDFLSPEGIITKKRSIDDAISSNYEQIDAISKENEGLNKQNEELTKKINEYKETLTKLQTNRAVMIQQMNSFEQQISTLKKTLASEETALKEQEDELFQENKQQENIAEQLEEIDEQIAELQVKGEKLFAELDDLNKQVEECNSKVSGKESVLKKKQDEKNRCQEQLENFNVNIARNETDIRNIKQNFQDNFSRDLMEFEERMYTISEAPESLRKKLADTKQKIQELGQVNFMAVEQFAEEKERYERQQESFADTKKSLDNLVRVNEEIRSKSAELFLNTYNKIRRNFHNMFRRMFSDNEGHGGGRADLRLVDPTNVLTTGVEIYAQPPGKKLQSISLLSGGEKTMTAMALLFATYQVHASPFCLLDEIDAALDNKNVISLVNVLRSFANVSQYIVITHNTKTALGAYTMIGVTMEESGVTKVVQMKKDEDTLNGNIPYEADNDFVDEDVEPEEGIVLPPRPPRREHNPDGSLKVPQEQPAVQAEVQADAVVQQEAEVQPAKEVQPDAEAQPDAEVLADAENSDIQENTENQENSSENQGSDIDESPDSVENIN